MQFSFDPNLREITFRVGGDARRVKNGQTYEISTWDTDDSVALCVGTGPAKFGA